MTSQETSSTGQRQRVNFDDRWMRNRTVLRMLTAVVQAAFSDAGYPDAVADVRVAGRAEHGDYQANGALTVAAARGSNPWEVAHDVVAKLGHGDMLQAEVARPGFINIRLSQEHLSLRIIEALRVRELGVETVSDAAVERIVIDYSSPNLAKEMHVGHLRSTIIGDALARVLRFIGHTVIAQSHVGDWGTQFGMLTAFMEDVDAAADLSSPLLADLEVFYREAKKRLADDPAFANRARERVVRLQRGDPKIHAAWRRFVDISIAHGLAIYRKLGVGLTAADVRGESAYNDDLPLIVADLAERGISMVDDGAHVVFVEDGQSKEGHPAPYIVQKSDGGYLYSTTDLAAVRYRSGVLKANRLLYVVDARQRLHFQQVYAICRRAGYAGNARMEHVEFGLVLGEDGRPFKTRSGETIKLDALLSEAVKRAFDLVTARKPCAPEDERNEIARVIGIGSVKYFDLAKNRTTDYVFDWRNILAFEGNTAPYLQYAYTRIRSILRQAGASSFCEAEVVSLTDATERELAVQLVRFPDAVLSVARDLHPSHLCTYLYMLATRFMRFYEACAVLQAAEATRHGRLMLCELTARTMKTGLDLLGIEVLETM